MLSEMRVRQLKVDSVIAKMIKQNTGDGIAAQTSNMAAGSQLIPAKSKMIRIKTQNPKGLSNQSAGSHTHLVYTSQSQQQVSQQLKHLLHDKRQSSPEKHLHTRRSGRDLGVANSFNYANLAGTTAAARPILKSEIRNKEQNQLFPKHKNSVLSTERRPGVGGAKSFNEDISKRFKQTQKSTTSRQHQIRHQPNSILSDSDKKMSKVGNKKRSLAFDVNTKLGADSGSHSKNGGDSSSKKHQRKQQLQQYDFHESKGSLLSPGDSIIELRGDIDMDFSAKVTAKRDKNGASKPGADLMTIESKSGDSYSRSAVVFEEDNYDHYDDGVDQQRRNVDICVQNEESTSQLDGILSLPDDNNEMVDEDTHSTYLSQNSLTKLQKMYKNDGRANSYMVLPKMAKNATSPMRRSHPLNNLGSSHRVTVLVPAKMSDNPPIVRLPTEEDVVDTWNAPTGVGNIMSSADGRSALTSRVFGAVPSTYSPLRQQKRLKGKFGIEARNAIEAKWDLKRQKNDELYDQKVYGEHVFQKRNERYIYNKTIELEKFDTEAAHSKFVKQHDNLRQDNNRCRKTSTTFLSPKSILSPHQGKGGHHQHQKQDQSKQQKQLQTSASLKMMSTLTKKKSLRSPAAMKPRMILSHDNLPKAATVGEERNKFDQPKLSQLQTMQTMPSKMMQSSTQQQLLGGGNTEMTLHTGKMATTFDKRRKTHQVTMLDGGFGGAASSSQYKTVDLKNGGGLLFDQRKQTFDVTTPIDPLVRGYNTLNMLQMSQQKMRSLVRDERLSQRENNRAGSQKPPKISMIDKLNHNPIDFQIGERNNVLKQRRSVQVVRDGSNGGSLPNYLLLRDKDGKTNIKVPTSSKTIAVNDIETDSDGELIDNKTAKGQPHNIMMLSKNTLKQNKFLNKFKDGLHKVVGSNGNKGSIFSQTHSAMDGQGQNPNDTQITASTVSENALKLTKYQSMMTQTGSQETNKTRKLAYSNFESHLNAIVIARAHQGNLGSTILRYISKPEMGDYIDYPKAALKATSTEIKTMLFELNRLMNSQAQMLTLETISATQYVVKTEGIELIPRLAIQCKVSIKERVAPLKLRFEFQDEQTGKRIRNPDVVLCLSSTVQCPTLENAQMTKTDFKDPTILLFRELSGKVFPELNPVNKKDKFPQYVYLSLESLIGCTCTISVSFPFEEKQRKAEQVENPKQIIKQQRGGGSQGQLSKEEERYKELQTLVAMNKISYRRSYELNKKFIKEEIQKISDHNGYVCQAMKQSNEKRVQRSKVRIQQRKKNKDMRQKNELGSIQNFFKRRSTLIHLDSNNVLELDTERRNSLNGIDPELFMKTMKSVICDNDQVPSKDKQYLKRETQSVKNEIKMIKAQELKKAITEKNHKLKVLNLHKQELLKAYRANELAKSSKYMKRQKIIKKWIVLARIWLIFSQLHKNFHAMIMIERIKSRQHKAQLIIRRAAKWLLTSTIKGRSLPDRMIMRASHSSVFTTALMHKPLESEAKSMILNFMHAMHMKKKFTECIHRIQFAVKIVKRNWNQYKFKYVIREAIMKSRMDQIKQGAWFREANIAKTKIVSKGERNAFINNSVRIYDNKDFEKIVIRNLRLFSKLVKYETTLNQVRFRIEQKTCEAKTMLKKLEKEEVKERAKGQCSEDFSSSEEREDYQHQKALREESKQEQLKKLEEAGEMRKSKFIRIIEHKYDQILKEVTRLDQDRFNYGIFCWKGLDGYEKLTAAASLFKKQGKMQSGKALKKDKHQTNFRKNQAQIISSAFANWIKRRRREFNDALQSAIQKRDFSAFKIRRNDEGHMIYVPITAAQFLPNGRFTQPEETAFMFLRIIDEIHQLEEDHSHMDQKERYSNSYNINTFAQQQQLSGKVEWPEQKRSSAAPAYYHHEQQQSGQAAEQNYRKQDYMYRQQM